MAAFIYIVESFKGIGRCEVYYDGQHYIYVAFPCRRSYIFGVVLGLGVLGVWIGMFVDWAARSLCFVIRFVSGKWLERGSLA